MSRLDPVAFRRCLLFLGEEVGGGEVAQGGELLVFGGERDVGQGPDDANVGVVPRCLLYTSDAADE